MIVGTQVLALGLCAHAYGTYFMGEKDPWFDRMRARFRLEHGLLLGGAFMLVGVVIGAVILATLDLPRLRLARRRTPRRDRRVAADRRASRSSSRRSCCRSSGCAERPDRARRPQPAPRLRLRAARCRTPRASPTARRSATSNGEHPDQPHRDQMVGEVRGVAEDRSPSLRRAASVGCAVEERQRDVADDGPAADTRPRAGDRARFALPSSSDAVSPRLTKHAVADQRVRGRGHRQRCDAARDSRRRAG